MIIIQQNGRKSKWVKEKKAMGEEKTLGFGDGSIGMQGTQICVPNANDQIGKLSN